jgi:hypothetical protein
MTLMLTGKQIPLARLLTLRAALKMQIAGMTGRGRRASVVIKEEYGMPKGLSLKETLERFEVVVEAAKKEFYNA